LRKRPLPRS